MKAIGVIVLIAVGLLTTYYMFMADDAAMPSIDIERGSPPLESSPPSTAGSLSAQGTQPVLFWHIVPVDGQGTFDSSLVLDKDDLPHLSYPTNTQLDSYLNFAYLKGSEWESEIADNVEPPYEFAGKPVLKLDGAGHLHIGYAVCHPLGCYLNYAHWTGSQWSIQQIDIATSGGSISMALDERDRPHFSYCTQRDESLELRYAYWASSQWYTTTIDGGRRCWYSTSIDVDSSGRPHISYYNLGAGDLMYANWTGTTWITQTVDSDGIVGDNNSLMLDTSDRPHIGYFDGSDKSLKYAVWTGVEWAIQTIDSAAGNLGAYISLVLDGQDRPHFTYTDSGNNNIKYARWTGTEWFTYTVGAGTRSWLALDSTNQPHISYANDGLKYAWSQVLTMKTYLPLVFTGQ